MDKSVLTHIAETKYRINEPVTFTHEEKKMKKLYEFGVNGVKMYGHKLAVNSAGQWVIEVKGSGDVIAVDKALVEEVLPHTIAIQFETSKMLYHYSAEVGKYSVGEFYIMDAPNGRAIVQVMAVDTKSPQATKDFNPLAKLVTA